MADYPDFEGVKSKLFTVADWAAIEATDKNFQASGTDKGFADTLTLSYAVPSGKTLYITQLGVGCQAKAAADGDKNQISIASIIELLGAGILVEYGTNGGGVAVFSKPLVLNGGYTAQFSVTIGANHTCFVVISAGGYEV